MQTEIAVDAGRGDRGAIPSRRVTMTRRTNALVVANGKGGVGKTTTAANLAAEAAATGLQVLAVDLDGQRNLATALGLVPDNHALHQTVSAERDRLSYAAWTLPADAKEGTELLCEAINAGEWDLVIIDTPPSATSPSADAALGAARWLLAPVRCDRHSIDGLALLLSRVRDAGDGRLDPLGVCLFAVPVRATALRRDTLSELEDLLGENIAVLQASIRYAERAQTDALDMGVTAREYAAIAANQRPWYLDRKAPRLASNAAELAEDYHALAMEVLAKIPAAVPA